MNKHKDSQKDFSENTENKIIRFNPDCQPELINPEDSLEMCLLKQLAKEKAEFLSPLYDHSDED